MDGLSSHHRQTPKYLIRDNDGKFGSNFKTLFQSSGIKDINTPVRAPRVNAICERFIGSLKRECLDSHLILQQQQLQRIVKKYVSYYVNKRPHQGLGQNIPNQHDKLRSTLFNEPQGSVVSKPIFNGLHHHYAYAVQ